MKWIHKRVVTKTDPESVDKLTLGPVLKKLGIQTVTFKVASTNEAILSKYMIILGSLGKVASQISKELFDTLMIIYC